MLSRRPILCLYRSRASGKNQWLVELIGANLTDHNFRLRKVLIEERLFNSELTYYDDHI